MSWKAKSFEDAKNSRTSRIWCFVSLLTRIRLGRREGPMEIDSDSGDDGDYETLGLLAVAVASFAKGKHNMIEDEDGCRYTWEMLMMERTPRLRRRRGRHRHARRRVFPRRDHIASAWAQMLRREALNDHHSAGGEFFRRRFRVPYVFFVQLVEVVEDRGWFKAGPCENVRVRSGQVQFKKLVRALCAFAQLVALSCGASRPPHSASRRQRPLSHQSWTPTTCWSGA